MVAQMLSGYRSRLALFSPHFARSSYTITRSNTKRREETHTRSRCATNVSVRRSVYLLVRDGYDVGVDEARSLLLAMSRRLASADVALDLVVLVVARLDALLHGVGAKRLARRGAMQTSLKVRQQGGSHGVWGGSRGGCCRLWLEVVASSIRARHAVGREEASRAVHRECSVGHHSEKEKRHRDG